MLEAQHVGDFYRIFPALPEALRGKDVLDFGCGYGGKTMEYGRRARTVAGAEVFANMVELARAYADHLGVPADFRLAAQDRLPFDDRSFDIVVSHDVLEHVDDPAASLAEIARVLRPGGVAFLAFPPYDGALSHHLDYLTLAPGLHWLFAPQTLVEAVNRELARRPILKPQPTPRQSWDGSRDVLPGLNGLTVEAFRAVAARGFNVAASERHRIGHNRSGIAATVAKLIGAVAEIVPAWRDHFTGTFTAVLVKPEVSGRERHLEGGAPVYDEAARARV